MILSPHPSEKRSKRAVFQDAIWLRGVAVSTNGQDSRSLSVLPPLPTRLGRYVVKSFLGMEFQSLRGTQLKEDEEASFSCDIFLHFFYFGAWTIYSKLQALKEFEVSSNIFFVFLNIYM